MGNVNEATVPTTTGSNEEYHELNVSDEQANQEVDDAPLIVPEIEKPLPVSAQVVHEPDANTSTSVQRIQPNLATPDRISRPPSHVLVHDADASNVWIPLPDTSVSLDALMSNSHSANSSNSSFPLSESQLPDTFDASFDLNDMSDYFPNRDIASLNSKPLDTSAPAEQVELIKDEPNEDNIKIEMHLIDSDEVLILDHITPDRLLFPAHSPVLPAPCAPVDGEEIQPKAAQVTKLHEPVPAFITDSDESLAEQFSKLESTVSILLSSPAPAYSVVMDKMSVSQDPERQHAIEIESSNAIDVCKNTQIEQNPQPTLPDHISFLDDTGTLQQAPPAHTSSIRHAEQIAEPVLPDNISYKDDQELPLASTPTVLHEEKETPNVVTYADATNLAMQFPSLATHFLTCPLPVPVKETTVPNTPAPALPPVKRHRPSSPHWAAAPGLKETKIPETVPSPRRPQHDDAEMCASAQDKKAPRRRRGRNSQKPGSPVSVVQNDTLGSRRSSTRSTSRNEGKSDRRGSGRRSTPQLGIPLLKRLSEPNGPEKTPPGGHARSPRSRPKSHETRSASVSRRQSNIGTSINKPLDTDPWSGEKDAMTSPRERQNKAISISGKYDDVPQLLGRHVISARSGRVENDQDTKGTETHRVTRKQQVAGISVAAKRYLSGSADDARRPSSGASSRSETDKSGTPSTSNDPPQILPPPGGRSTDFGRREETNEEKFHRMGGKTFVIDFQANSGSPGLLDTSSEVSTQNEPTPGDSPFRDIHLRTINTVSSPHRSPRPTKDAPADPRSLSLSLNSRPPQSIATGYSSQENHTVSSSNDNTVTIDLQSQRLNCSQHSTNDWLPAIPFRSNIRTSVPPAQILHYANSSGAFLPPHARPDSSAPRADSSAPLPFGLDPRISDTSANWFKDQATFTITPSVSSNSGSRSGIAIPRGSRGYSSSGHSGQSLPPLSHFDALARQHMYRNTPENHESEDIYSTKKPSHETYGMREGVATNRTAQYTQPRHHTRDDYETLKNNNLLHCQVTGFEIGERKDWQRS